MRVSTGSAFSEMGITNRKTVKRRPARRDRQNLKLCLENLEQRNLLTSVTFQQGVGGYTGTQDTVLFSISPNVNFGTETGISVDQQDANGARQGLLKFGNIVGNGPNQIPAGSTINSATLTVSIFNDSNSEALISMYRMLQDWDQNVATWNSFGSIGGIQASQGEVEGLPPDATLFDPSTGIKTFDVTTSLRHWAAGEANYGWLFESATTNGWDYNTSEAAPADRPMLTVDYTPPSGAGQFRFLNLTPVHTEKDGSTSVAMLTVARVGGSTGAVSIDYTIAAGSTNPATAGTDFVAAGPITLNFANGETVQSVPVTINGDVDLEGLETVAVSLTNAQGGATIDGAADEAALTIADDDALINEILADVSNASDETNREYIELLGTPGASLTGYYFVVFEGEEESDGGAGNGIADLVIDLTGQTFGSNGLLVITGTSWAYTKDAATNQFATAALDGVAGKLEDSSQTYALVRSTTAIVQGTDYDTIGAYENATQTAVGAGVGILDQAPFTPGGGAQIVDSVGVLEGGGGDRDRVATLQYPGVHIHQPIGNNSEVTPDTLARRLGERTPNSSGPWFNGEIENGNLPAVYASGAGKRNVVTPAGAQITPGAENILRTVAFAVTAIEVDESAGTATLTVTRFGDSSQAISVDYSTANGTAIAGPPGTGDYTAIAGGVLNFGVGSANDSQNIVITILTDSSAEGFETFSVNLTGATAPFQVITASATVTISDADVLVKTFQDGVNGYSGTADTYLRSNLPDDVFGSAATVIVDQEIGTQTGVDGRPSQGLIRFDDVFGAALNQVPLGSKIFSAFLTLNVLNPTAGDAQVKLYRMLQSWDEHTATWSNPRGSDAPIPTIINGITPDDVEATADFDASLTNPGGSGTSVQIPLNVETIQAWANGALPNFGWSFLSDSGNDWVFASSDDFLSINPFFPELTILYTAPTGTGTFQFTDDSYKVNENGTASITVERVGGGTLGAPMTVNWGITLETASAGDISGPTSGVVTFSGNELTKTITIPIVNDSSLERNETLNIALSTPATSVPGDFDGDSDVDGADFVAWQTNFPKPSGATLAQGDADGDGDVDGADFVVWQTNFPTSSAGPVVHDTAVLTIRDNDFSTSSPSLLISELFINSPGNDGGHEFIELTGTADSAMGSLYLAIFDGDAGFGAGTTDLMIDLGPYLNGSSGYSIVQALNTFDFRVPGGVTQIMTALLDLENVDNDSASYAILYSPTTSLSTGPIDYDWDNDGSLELPTGVVIIDSIAIKDNGALDQTYGPASNIINSATNPNIFVADAVSRLRGNTVRNNSSAWYWGDLFAAGDDPLVYDATNQKFVPVTGAALTPGEINTGTAAQSPLVQLTAVTPNAPVGSVTLTFSGPISQFLKGGGFPGVKITDTSNAPVPGVNVNPTVAGLGTSTLTLTFTGSSVSGGLLPAGDYRLTFVGKSLIGNGRAVDTNGGAADAAGSDFTFDFNVPAAGSAPEGAAFAGSSAASAMTAPENTSAEPAGTANAVGAFGVSSSSTTKSAPDGAVAALFSSLANPTGSNIARGIVAWQAASDRVWQSFDKLSTEFDQHDFAPVSRRITASTKLSTIDAVFGAFADDLGASTARSRRGLLAKA